MNQDKQLYFEVNDINSYFEPYYNSNGVQKIDKISIEIESDTILSLRNFLESKNSNCMIVYTYDLPALVKCLKIASKSINRDSIIHLRSKRDITPEVANTEIIYTNRKSMDHDEYLRDYIIDQKNRQDYSPCEYRKIILLFDSDSDEFSYRKLLKSFNDVKYLVHGYSKAKNEKLSRLCDRTVSEILSDKFPSQINSKIDMKLAFQIISSVFISDSADLWKNVKIFWFASTILNLFARYCEKICNRMTDMSSAHQRIEKAQQDLQMMTSKLEQEKITANNVKRQCEIFLADLTQKKRAFNEETSKISERSAILEEEQISMQKLAEQAEFDLKRALPALEEGKKSLQTINKRDIAEIRSYGRPSSLVEKVMEAVMILRNSEPNWSEAKRQLSDPNFLRDLFNFDPVSVSDKTLKKISNYCSSEEFKPEVVGNVSEAAKSLCEWVIAIERYCQVYKIVEPKKLRLNAALKDLKNKKEKMEESKAELQQFRDQLNQIEIEYAKYTNEYDTVKKKVLDFEAKTKKISSIIAGVSKEAESWDQEINDMRDRVNKGYGDSILAAFSLEFQGNPEIQDYPSIMSNLKQILQTKGIHVSQDFTISSYLDIIDEFSSEVSRVSRNDTTFEKTLIACHSTNISLIWDSNGFFRSKIHQLFEHKREIIEISYGYDINETLQRIEHDCSNKLILLDMGNSELVKESLNNNIIERLAEAKNLFLIYSSVKKPSKLIYDTNVNVLDFNLIDEDLRNIINSTIIERENNQIYDGKERISDEVFHIKKEISKLKEQILCTIIKSESNISENEEIVPLLSRRFLLTKHLRERSKILEISNQKYENMVKRYERFSTACLVIFRSLVLLGLVDSFNCFTWSWYKSLMIESTKYAQFSSKIEDRVKNLEIHHIQVTIDTILKSIEHKYSAIFLFLVSYIFKNQDDEMKLQDLIILLKFSRFDANQHFSDHSHSSRPEWVNSSQWIKLQELENYKQFSGIASAVSSEQWKEWHKQIDENKLMFMPPLGQYILNDLQKLTIISILNECYVEKIMNNLSKNILEYKFKKLKLDMDVKFKVTIEDEIIRNDLKLPILIITENVKDLYKNLTKLCTYELKMRINIYRIDCIDMKSLEEAIVNSSVEGGYFIIDISTEIQFEKLENLCILLKKIPNLEISRSFRLILCSVPALKDYLGNIPGFCSKFYIEQQQAIKYHSKRMVKRLERTMTKYDLSNNNNFRKDSLSLLQLFSFLLRNHQLSTQIHFERLNLSSFEVSLQILAEIYSSFGQINRLKIWRFMREVIFESVAADSIFISSVMGMMKRCLFSFNLEDAYRIAEGKNISNIKNSIESLPEIDSYNISRSSKSLKRFFYFSKSPSNSLKYLEKCYADQLLWGRANRQAFDIDSRKLLHKLEDLNFDSQYSMDPNSEGQVISKLLIFEKRQIFSLIDKLKREILETSSTSQECIGAIYRRISLILENLQKMEHNRISVQGSSCELLIDFNLSPNSSFIIQKWLDLPVYEHNDIYLKIDRIDDLENEDSKSRRPKIILKNISIHGAKIDLTNSKLIQLEAIDDYFQFIDSITLVKTEDFSDYFQSFGYDCENENLCYFVNDDTKSETLVTFHDRSLKFIEGINCEKRIYSELRILSPEEDKQSLNISCMHRIDRRRLALGTNGAGDNFVLIFDLLKMQEERQIKLPKMNGVNCLSYQ
ncbi:MAG: hypothetical protein MHMPM18_000474 [Marteilia pararefringens]